MTMHYIDNFAYHYETGNDIQKLLIIVMNKILIMNKRFRHVGSTQPTFAIAGSKCTRLVIELQRIVIN